MIWTDDTHAIIKVAYYEPPDEIAAKYPFSCAFYESSAIGPDQIGGVLVASDSKSYVLCTTDNEVLVFDATREMNAVEKGRLKIDTGKRAWQCSAITLPENELNRLKEMVGSLL